MRGRAPLSRSSYVRDLPFSVVKHLACELDLENLWEKFVEHIPKYLNSEDGFEPRYTAQHVGLFNRQQMISNGSPTRAILQDWGTQNCTVQHLLTALYDAELVTAADFIRIDILREAEEPEAEDAHVNQLPIPQALLPPMVINAVPGDHHHHVAESIEPSIDTQFETTEKGMPEPQNDLSLAPLSLMSSKSDHDTRKYQGSFRSTGGAGALLLAESSPNFNPLKEHEKVQNKGWEKKIERDLLPPHEFEPGYAKAGPVIKNTGDLQQVSYGDLEVITDSFNVEPYSDGGRLIGQGGFGRVHLGLDQDQNRVAVKVLSDHTETSQKQFRTEVETLSNLRHKNLLTLIAYSCDGPKSCIVYDYMPNGSLEDRLACVNGTPPLSAETRISICKGSAHAIAYLHSRGLIHRDIKSANIVLDKDFVAKLGDFATARSGPSGNSKTQAGTSVLIGTSAYLAPEAHNFDVSAKLDSYSFGVVTLELLTGLPAYDASREDRDLRSHMFENCNDIMDMVDRYAGDWVESTVRTLYDIAFRCLEMSKKKRALVHDVLHEIQNL